MSDDARPLIDNPYRASSTPIYAGDVNVTDLMARAWERGFAAGQSQAWDSAQAEIDAIRAAGRAAATPDPPASRALGNAMRERDEAWLDAGTARAEERARIVKALREAAHGGNRGQPGSFWVGWRAAARAIEEGWAEKPETDT
jgi:hypothetical protein